MEEYKLNQFEYNSYITSPTCANTEKLSTNESIFDIAGVKAVAHRGDSDDAPENTLPAFELAKENGYDFVECDISWTNDDVPVLLHDSTINRTIGESLLSGFMFPKYCSDLSYEEISKYDFGSWFSKQYADTKIPTFDEMLDCCKENDLNVYVEIKDNVDFDIEKAQKLINSVAEKNLQNNVTWISFNDDYLEIIKNLSNDSRIGYLSESKITQDTIDTLDNLKTNDNEVFLNIKSSKVKKEGVELLNNAGYDFESWTVNDIDELENLFELGCSGITTDTLSKDEIENTFYQ